MARIELAHVDVTFRIFDAGQRSFLRRLLPFGRGAPAHALDIAALSDIGLTLEPGSRVAILGPNSSGKTTLLRVMAGLLPARRGTVALEGRAGGVFSMGFGVDPEARLAEIAYAQGLLMGHRPAVARAKVGLILELAEIEAYGDCQARVAPPGILFRLGIAAMLCLEADIIVLDEVLENLDPRFLPRFRDLLVRRTEAGAILVMSERSRGLLLHFCTEAILLGEGRVAGRGPLAEILTAAGAALTF